MQRQSPLGHDMATNRRQRFALQIDRQEMLKRPEGDDDAAEAPVQAQLAHILRHQGQALRCL